MLIAAIHTITATKPVVISHFWPATLSSWAAILAGVAAPLAVIFGVRNHGTIQQIHTLSNGRLLAVEKQRDSLLDQREAAHPSVTIEGATVKPEGDKT